MTLLQNQKLYNEPVQLNDLVTALEEKEHDYWDSVVPVSDLSLNMDGHLTIKRDDSGFNEYPLQDQALQCLAEKTRVPYSYVSRVEPWIQAVNINHQLNQHSNKEYLVRFDGDQVRAVLSNKYADTPMSTVMSMVSKYLDDKGFYNPKTKFEWTPSRFTCQILLEENNGPVKVGNTMASGICISSSSIGKSALRCSAFIMVYSCSNGMVIKNDLDNYRRIHLGNGEVIFDEFEDNLNRVVASLPGHLNTFNQTRQIPVPNPTVAIENISKRFKLTKDITERVVEGWHYEKRGNNLFALINAYTYVGSNVRDLKLTDRENLQALSSKLLTYSPQQLKRLSIPFESAA